MHKKVVALLMIAFVMLYADAFKKHFKQRGFEVEIESKGALSAGKNSFLLKLEKRGLDPKKIRVKFFMPAMPGMPYMESFAKVTPVGKTLYKLEVNLVMGGTWQVHIYIYDKSGKKYKLKTSVNL